MDIDAKVARVLQENLNNVKAQQGADTMLKAMDHYKSMVENGLIKKPEYNISTSSKPVASQSYRAY